MSQCERLGQTPSQTAGPYFAYGLTPAQYDYDWVSLAGPNMADATTLGQSICIEGQVFDGAGVPITDALIEFWHANSAGQYLRSVQPNSAFTGFGRCGTGTEPGGRFRFQTIKPGALSPIDAPHINVTVLMRGLLLHAFTRLYFGDEVSANDCDQVLAVVPAERRLTLMAHHTGHGVYRFDIRMQGDAETVFFDI
jgi:protocatechuate 3,4-dioxygenase, alpha subunit